MTQEEKQLLLKVLCAELPYGVKTSNGHGILKLSPRTDVIYIVDNGHIPYLRPLSSMTEEEINEFILISDTTLWLGNKRLTCILSLEQMDWLDKKMFDYRGLIEKGLALEAPEVMYKKK